MRRFIIVNLVALSSIVSCFSAASDFNPGNISCHVLADVLSCWQLASNRIRDIHVNQIGNIDGVVTRINPQIAFLRYIPVWSIVDVRQQLNRWFIGVKVEKQIGEYHIGLLLGVVLNDFTVRSNDVICRRAFANDALSCLCNSW